MISEKLPHAPSIPDKEFLDSGKRGILIFYSYITCLVIIVQILGILYHFVKLKFITYGICCSYVITIFNLYALKCIIGSYSFLSVFNLAESQLNLMYIYFHTFVVYYLQRTSLYH